MILYKPVESAAKGETGKWAAKKVFPAFLLIVCRKQQLF
jgi:hypothetical protein